MKYTQIFIITLAIIIFGGVVYLWTKDGNGTGAPEKTQNATNSTVLLSDKNTEISKETVEYFNGANGYYVRPAENSNYPGIVVIHENRGLRPEIKTMAEELAKEGYAVLAVDLFGKTVETQAEAGQLTANFDQTKGIQNLKAAVKYLKDQGSTKIASLGWCFGGGQSMQLALSDEKLDATIIYYGRLETDEAKLNKIKWPVLGIFGDKDRVISTSSVQQFHSSIEKLNITHEIYTYPDVGHAFANPSGANYAPEQTKDAWNKTTAFLNRYLKA